MRNLLRVVLFLMLGGVVSALSPDATREQVIAELGKPISMAKLGQREILNFPQGVKVEFENGRIVSAKGIVLSDSSDVPGAIAPALVTTAPTVPKAKAGGKSTAQPALNEDEQAEENDAAAEKEYAKEQDKYMKSVEGMAAEHEQGFGARRVAVFNALQFIVEVLLKIFVTVAALKISCKYWGDEVFWSGVLIIAAVDTALRSVMKLIGELVLGFPSLFFADEAVASIVMVLLLKKYSINRSTSQAVTIMFTTKTFSIIVGMFLITVFLRMVF